MKKILKLALASSLATATVLNADTIGFEVGAGYWNSKTTGTIQKGTTNIDLENDLGYGSSNGVNTFYALIEHPVPLVPNFKIQQTNLSDNATAIAPKIINFNGKTFNLNDSIASSYKLDQTDFIAYYEVLDNWVNLDLGLNIKYIDGSIQLDTTTTHASETFDAYIPMLYAKAQADLPFTGFSVESEINYIGYSGSSFYDFKAAAQYETEIGFGVEAGYRQMKLKIDDLDDFNSDIKVNGIYASVFYHF